MKKNLWLIAAFAVVLAAPLLLRPRSRAAEKSDETLIVITPHNEATRSEFSRAFSDAHFKKTGRRVEIDWRTVGGANEISRFIAAQYLGSFQNYWTNQLRRPWSTQVQGAFANAKVKAAENEARRAFLESKVGCGIDMYFGGGSYDFVMQAAAGRLVDCGAIRAHPELFNATNIPQNLGGEPLWDADGRWIGACLGSFGICYNFDSLRRLNLEPPEQWKDLSDPKYFGEIALADPTQSGAAAKAFEMLIQQQMQNFPGEQPVNDGWAYALKMIQRIAGNARYFTDSGAKIPLDVEMGNAAAGMCIDFYGRFQSGASGQRGGECMGYVTPAGGSSFGSDPIGVFRGAPHPDLARDFVEFVLSTEGQKLWNWKVGTPGGPEKYALRRLPIRPELYDAEFAVFRSDPEVLPYAQENVFQYRAERTAPLFRVISFVIRAMCIDPHEELREAWRALIAADFPPEAMNAFQDVSIVDYEISSTRIRTALAGEKIAQVKLAKELSDSFRAQYLRAAELARAGK